MQLLIKLDLIPDPDRVDGADEGPNKMTQEEREARLKEVGLFIPQSSIDAMNKEMERLREGQQSYADMMLAEKASRLSKEEIHTLKKLGMSMKEIAELEPDQNPFTDKGLGAQRDFAALLALQQEFYEKLKAAYQAEMGDDPFAKAKANTESAGPEGENEVKIDLMRTPENIQEWSKKRQL